MIKSHNVRKFTNLISLFIIGKISAVEFEHKYLQLFKNDQTNHSKQLFLVLDKLFGDVDAFCPDPMLRDEFDLDEQALQHACVEALEMLNLILPQKTVTKIKKVAIIA